MSRDDAPRPPAKRPAPASLTSRAPSQPQKLPTPPAKPKSEASGRVRAPVTKSAIAQADYATFERKRSLFDTIDVVMDTICCIFVPLTFSLIAWAFCIRRLAALFLGW